MFPAGLENVVAGVIVLALLAATAGLLLGWLRARVPAGGDGDVERVNALLPQIQCAQCGYPGCRPYAAAIVAGTAPLDACPPGGEATARALAALTGRAAGAKAKAPWLPRIAVIDEDTCVGCFRCVEVCPVDAIVGAHRHAHTVLADRCTGCELCVPACPVDCIHVLPAAAAGGPVPRSRP